MRKPRKGEVVCRCAAYHFPHRMTGGRCTGSHIVFEAWERNYGGGDCRDCNSLEDRDGCRSCQVVEGAEAISECPVWQEFAGRNEIPVAPFYRVR